MNGRRTAWLMYLRASYPFHSSLSLPPASLAPTLQIHERLRHGARNWCRDHNCRGRGHRQRAMCRVFRLGPRQAGCARKKHRGRLSHRSRPWHVPGTGGSVAVYCGCLADTPLDAGVQLMLQIVQATCVAVLIIDVARIVSLPRLEMRLKDILLYVAIPPWCPGLKTPCLRAAFAHPITTPRYSC